MVLPELVTYSITKCNFSKHIQKMYMYKCTCTCASEFLIGFETWVKLAQQWLVCAPLGMHLEPKS